MSSYTSFGQSIAVTGVNLGFPGGVSRFGDRVIAARVFQPFTTTNVLNFGDPTVLIENATGGQWDSVADFIAHATSNIGLLAAQFAGMAVREVKQQITYPYNQTPGVQVLQNYGSGQMAEVLERGNGTVNFAVNNSGVAGGQVYTRVSLQVWLETGRLALRMRQMCSAWLPPRLKAARLQPWPAVPTSRLACSSVGPALRRAPTWQLSLAPH